MKLLNFLYILLLNILLLNVSCINMIGKDEEIKITNISKSGIVYIKLFNFTNYNDINIYLKAKPGEINDYIHYEFSNDQKIILEDYIEYQPKGKIVLINTLELYYEIPFKNYTYLILRYSGFNFTSDGYLIFKASDKEFDIEKLKIIVIVSFSTIFVIVIIAVSIAVYIYKRKKKNKNNIAPEDNIPPNSVDYSANQFMSQSQSEYSDDLNQPINK